MKNKLVQVIILVIGIILLVMGFNEYGAFGSRAGRLLGMGMSTRVIALFLVGAALTGYGLVNVMKTK